jgi:DNA-binding NtrC family response regulator
MPRRKVVLIVEDDGAMRESCAKLLSLEGFEVIEAGTALEAMKLVEERDDIDIMLSDIRLPGIDGIYLMKKVKAGRPGIEVIFMTGYATIKNAVEATKLGAADYISKPFDTSELLAAIENAIERKSLRQDVDEKKTPVNMVPSLSESEKELLVSALKQSDGNKTLASKILGISRPRLYHMMQRYGVK